MNGFIEVYMDARGIKGAWEGARLLRQPREDAEDRRRWRRTRSGSRITCRGIRGSASRRCTGVTAKAIEVVVETGDSGPITPIGINLPNDQAIREQYGSKSVSLSNVIEAYERSTPDGLRDEFCVGRGGGGARASGGARSRSELTTEMHEVLGHGSGRMADGVTAPPQELLKEQYSALEETRADLVALYFLADPKLVELGLVPADEHDDDRPRPSTRTTRATRWCSCGACAKARSSKKTTCATAR